MARPGVARPETETRPAPGSSQVRIVAIIDGAESKKFMSTGIFEKHIVFQTGEKPFSGPGFVNPVIKSSCQEES